MSWVPAEKVIQAVGTQRQVIAEQELRITNFVQYHATERAKLEAEQKQATSDLGLAVLPKLNTASIAAAAQAVGLVGLPSEDIPAKLEARRAWLVARIAEIRVNPNYANRELLRHPRTGSLVTAVAEAKEYRGLANQLVLACEEHPRFERLMEINYGTPQQESSWWRYSYWQDRSAAQEIVAKLNGKTTFAEVRDEYARNKESVATYDSELKRLRAQIRAGKALEGKHAALTKEHDELDAVGLEHTRGRIVQHMLGTDASLVSQQLRASSSPLLLLFLRASGLAAKIAYLDGIQQKNLDEHRREIAAQKEKLNAVETKTRRRWAPMPLANFQKLTEDRRPRFEKRWQRFGKVYNTVYVYDRWDRGRYYEDILWWDLMTRGRYDGSYLSDVASYHHSHPDYSFDPDWKSLAATHGDDSAAASEASDAEAAAQSIDADSAHVEHDGGGDSGSNDANALQTTDAS